MVQVEGHEFSMDADGGKSGLFGLRMIEMYRIKKGSILRF